MRLPIILVVAVTFCITSVQAQAEQFLAFDRVPIASEGAATSSPDDLYVGAIRRLEALPQRPYISYIMTHSQAHEGRPVGTYTEAVVERRVDKKSWNKTIAGTMGKIGDVSIGRHYLIPDAFLPYRDADVPKGLLPGIDTHDETALQTIARVHSALSYRVTLVSDEALNNCGPVAHLSLTPLRDPQRYNIRDLWVRRSDFRLCKAIFASRLYKEQGQGGSYPSIDTVELDANGLIASYSLFVQVHYLIGTYAITDEGTFSNISWASDEPAYLFDYAAWKASANLSNHVP